MLAFSRRSGAEPERVEIWTLRDSEGGPLPRLPARRRPRGAERDDAQPQARGRLPRPARRSTAATAAGRRTRAFAERLQGRRLDDVSVLGETFEALVVSARHEHDEAARRDGQPRSSRSRREQRAARRRAPDAGGGARGRGALGPGLAGRSPAPDTAGTAGPRSAGHAGSSVGASIPATTGRTSRDGRDGARDTETDTGARLDLAEAPDRLVAARRGSVTRTPRPGPVDVALVVERDGQPAPTCPSAAARRPCRRRLRTGSSSVLRRASSLRALARSQPLWTKVSCPSGRTSETVAWRSTLRAGGADPGLERAARRPRRCRPAAAHSRRTARVPAGCCDQRYGRRRRPQPVRAARGVADEARRRPRRAAPGELVDPGGRRRRVGERPAGREVPRARARPRQREAREGALEPG